MHGYDLLPFNNNKAFIHQDHIFAPKDNRICINTQGKVLFELPQNLYCNDFENEDVTFVMNGNGLYVLLNNKGEFLTDFIYNNISSGIEEGFFEVQRNSKHGHIDINGQETVPCIYEDGYYFSEGIAAECMNNKLGCVDFKNNTVIPFEYEDMFICLNNMIPAKKNGKWGCINKNNEPIIDFLYENFHVGVRECCVHPAKLNGKLGFIDKFGNVIEDFNYDEVKLCSDNDGMFGMYYTVKLDKKYALYSTVNSEFLTDFVYDEIGYYTYNRFRVYENYKYGYIDNYGEIIIPLIYENADEFFSDEIAVVKLKGKYGAVNFYGDVVIPFEYSRLHSSREGLLLASKNRKRGYIGRKNNVVIPFDKYKFCNKSFSNGYVAVFTMKDGSFYIDRNDNKLKININEGDEKH